MYLFYHKIAQDATMTLIENAKIKMQNGNSKLKII